MSEATKNLTETYDEIDLCYKVMGLSFSDPPDKVDRVYNGLVAEYSNSMKSTDPATRQSAKENLEQTKDLYERITGSMIYKDYAREYEKYKQLKAEQAEARRQKQEVEKELMVSCPYCRKLIIPTSKVCLYCHGKIYTPMELLLLKVFSKKNVAIMGSVLGVLIASGAALFFFKR